MAQMISGIKIPDSKLAREAAELVREYETEMLFNHSVRVYLFGAIKGIRENLTRQNLSAAIGTPCGSNIVFDGTPATDAQILASPDCQRVALVNFMQSTFSEKDGAPINHAIRNGAAFGRID